MKINDMWINHWILMGTPCLDTPRIPRYSELNSPGLASLGPIGCLKAKPTARHCRLKRSTCNDPEQFPTPKQDQCQSAKSKNKKETLVLK